MIIDTLRAFDANAEQRSDFGADLCRNIRTLNAEVGCATLLVLHHRRKPSLDHHVSLEEDPHVWFNEIVGTNALITQVDSRLGVDAAVRGPAELILGGFVRGHGPIQVHQLVRRFGADGLPVGYVLISGLDRLSPKQRKVFDDLGCDFTFTEVKKALGGSSDSIPANLITLLKNAGLVEQVRPSGPYRKKA